MNHVFFNEGTSAITADQAWSNAAEFMKSFRAGDLASVPLVPLARRPHRRSPMPRPGTTRKSVKPRH